MIGRRKITLVLLVLAILFAGNLLLLQVGVLQTNTLVNTASATHDVCTGSRTLVCNDVHCEPSRWGYWCDDRSHTINFTCRFDGSGKCNRNFWSELSNFCRVFGGGRSCSSGVGCEVLPSLKTINSCSVGPGAHARPPPPPPPLLHKITFTSTISVLVKHSGHSGGGCNTRCIHETTIDYPGTFRIEAPATKVSGGNTYDFIEWHVDAWTSTSRRWSIRLDDTHSTRTAIAHYRLRVVPPPPPPPPTVDIRANGSNGPITITYNTSASIRWTSSNATACNIPELAGSEGLNGSRGSGLLRVSKTYRLNCSGPGGTRTDSVRVNVNPPSLTASLLPLPSGGDWNLSVRARAGAGGTAIGTINYTFYCNSPGPGAGVTSPWNYKRDGISNNPLNTPVICTYTTAGTKTMKVIVERDGLARAAFASITVTEPPPAVTLTATPPSPPGILRGSSAVLKWTTFNADSCSINQGIGSVSHVSGSTKTVAPTVPTTYKLTCSGPGSPPNASASVFVDVTIIAPVISEFKATPAVVFEGGQTTLSWVVNNILDPPDVGCSATASPFQGDWVGTIAVPPDAGSKVVTPSGGTVTYTLTCTNTAGTDTKSTTVTVPFLQEVLP